MDHVFAQLNWPSGSAAARVGGKIEAASKLRGPKRPEDRKERDCRKIAFSFNYKHIKGP